MTTQELQQSNLKEICQALHDQFDSRELVQIYEESLFGIVNLYLDIDLTQFMREWFADDLVSEPCNYLED